MDERDQCLTDFGVMELCLNGLQVPVVVSDKKKGTGIFYT